MSHALSTDAVRPARSIFKWTAFAFVYWVIFMGTLAPGNISHALDAGVVFDPVRELIRLCAAGALGASATPLLLWVASRASLSRERFRRNLCIQAGAVIALSPFLIVVSCFLVAWVGGRLAPPLQGILDQLFANFLLLILCNAILLGSIQIAPRVFDARPGREPEWARTLLISERGRATIVDLDTVEWVEAQGNYQALHTGDGVYLYRVTSAALEALLDPLRFVRIHRRHLVAIRKVQSIEPLQSGDAAVVLRSGTRLRQSRQYRGALQAAVRS